MLSIHESILEENLHHLNKPYNKIWSMSLNAFEPEFCDTVINNSDRINMNLDIEIKEQIERKIMPFIPTTYANSKFVGLSFKVTTNLEKQKSLPTKEFDNEGNYGKLYFKVFLNDQVYSNESLTKKRYMGGDCTWYTPRPFTLPGIRGSIVLFDENYEYESEAVLKGTKKVLSGCAIYSLTPLSFLIIKAKEIETTKDYGINQLIIEEIKMFERALKKRAFNNKTHSVEKDLKYNCKMRFDPRYDLCNCCNSYIPIKSKNCEYCSDEIISDNNVIERRLSGKW